jgi:RNA polymerase sigma factor (sigma-70 family)
MNGQRYFDKPKHPDFDKYWPDYHKLIFWWSKKLARIYKKAHIDADEFVGYLVLRFNYILYFWDASISKLGNLFQKHLITDTLRVVLQYESEAWHAYIYKECGGMKGIKIQQLEKDTHESDFFMYRIPENTSWTDQIIDLFPDTETLWNHLTHGLTPRYKDVMLYYWRDGKTYAEIAELMGVTKQRIEQIEKKGRASIKNTIKKLEVARELFFGKQDEIPELSAT